MTIQKINTAYCKMMGLDHPEVKKMNTLSSVLAFALLVITCLGMSGVIPGSRFGWTVLGLGGATMLLHLHGGNLKNRKIDLISWAIFASTLIVLGALGGTNILSNVQVGYGCLTVLTASLIFYGVILRGIAAKKVHAERATLAVV